MNIYDRNSNDSDYSIGRLLDHLKDEINLTEQEKQAYITKIIEVTQGSSEQLDEQTALNSESSRDESQSDSECSSDLLTETPTSSEILLPTATSFEIEQTCPDNEEAYFSEWTKFSVGSDFWESPEENESFPLR